MQTFRTAFSAIRGIHREAAIDSFRNVLGVIGFGAIVGDFAAMRPFYAIPLAVLFVVIWYADYLRHF